MLRIGMDDGESLPDIAVSADQCTIARPWAYDDRTSAWPLRYRGELRKRLQYARDRG